MVSLKIKEFFEDKIKSKMNDYSKDMHDYVMDVYVDVAPRHKVWLIDFNPWIPESVDPLLFNWVELNNRDS